MDESSLAEQPPWYKTIREKNGDMIAYEESEHDSKQIFAGADFICPENQKIVEPRQKMSHLGN